MRNLLSPMPQILLLQTSLSNILTRILASEEKEARHLLSVTMQERLDVAIHTVTFHSEQYFAFFHLCFTVYHHWFLFLIIRWLMILRVFWRRIEIYCTWTRFSSLPNAKLLCQKCLHLRCWLNQIILCLFHIDLVLLILKN